MKQIGLTLVALVLVVSTAIPAHAATKTVKATSVSTRTQFTLITIFGTNWCC